MTADCVKGPCQREPEVRENASIRCYNKISSKCLIRTGGGFGQREDKEGRAAAP